MDPGEAYTALLVPGRYAEAAATRCHRAGHQNSRRTADEEEYIAEAAGCSWGGCNSGLPSKAGLEEEVQEEEPSSAFQYRGRDHGDGDDEH